MDPLDLSGKNAIVLGVANHRSIAWGIARELSARGARLALTYQGERFKGTLEKLSVEAGLVDPVLIPLDVNDDAQLDACFVTLKDAMGGLDMLAHCVAYARREDLEGDFRDTDREGFRIAVETSAYSLLALARRATPLMQGRNAAMIALSYLAAEHEHGNRGLGALREREWHVLRVRCGEEPVGRAADLERRVARHGLVFPEPRAEALDEELFRAVRSQWGHA